MIQFAIHRLVGMRPDGTYIERYFKPGVSLTAIGKVWDRWVESKNVAKIRLERYEGIATRTVLRETTECLASPSTAPKSQGST